jgi:hypothetical protein
MRHHHTSPDLEKKMGFAHEENQMLMVRDIRKDCEGLHVQFNYNGKEREGTIHEVHNTFMIVSLYVDGDTVIPSGKTVYKSFTYSKIDGYLELFDSQVLRDLMDSRR